MGRPMLIQTIGYDVGTEWNAWLQAQCNPSTVQSTVIPAKLLSHWLHTSEYHTDSRSWTHVRQISTPLNNEDFLCGSLMINVQDQQASYTVMHGCAGRAEPAAWVAVCRISLAFRRPKKQAL